MIGLAQLKEQEEVAMTIKLYQIALVVLIIANCRAYGESAQEYTPYEKLMEVSGVNSQTGGLGERMAPGMSDIFSGGRLSTNQAGRLVGAFKQCFQSDTVLGDIEARLRDTLPEEIVQGALAWLEKPLGRRITKAEIEADLPENEEERSAFRNQVSNIPEARKSLVADLIKAMDSVELERKCYGRFAETMELYMALERGKEPPSAAERRKPVDAYLRERAGEFEERRLAGSLYCYQSFSDADIQAYLDFVQSDVGKKYHEAVNAAIYGALVDGYIRFDSAMLGIFGRPAV